MIFLVVIDRSSLALFANQFFSQMSWICQHLLGRLAATSANEPIPAGIRWGIAQDTRKP